MSRTTTTAAAAFALVGALSLSACGGGGPDPLATSSSGSAQGGGGEVVVGSADFSESILLAHIYAGALEADGVNATTRTNIGSREIYLKALEDGSVDVMPEYTGALAVYYDKTFSETDPEKVYSGLQKELPEGLTVLEKSAAEDKDSIAVSRKTADEKNLTTIDDLEPVAGELTLGAPSEFQNREQGVKGLKSQYGVEFGQFRALKGAALVNALKNGQVHAANLFSTDPNIAANDFVVLEDEKNLFGSQNVVPLVTTDVEEQVSPSLNKVSKALTTEKLTAMLQKTDIDKEDPEKVADEFLEDEGITS